MSDEHLAGRGLALGVVGGAMHGPAAVGGGVSDQEQLKIEDEQRHPLDDRLVVLSEQLAHGHVPATAAELVMEARDEIARMHWLLFSHSVVRFVPGKIPAEVLEEIESGAIVRLDPESDARVLCCPACDVSRSSPCGDEVKEEQVGGGDAH